MATSPKPRARKASLPPVLIAKLEETGRLIERLVEENQAVFVEKANVYRELHRERTSRPLSCFEATRVAAGMAASEGGDPIALAVSVQQSDLRVHEAPDVRELLLSAAVAMVPAFIGAVRQLVALIEMPSGEFEEAREGGTLEDAIERRAKELLRLELGEARKRAVAAFEHYAKAGGVNAGEVWRLPVQSVLQALRQAMVDIAVSTPDAATLVGASDE